MAKDIWSIPLNLSNFNIVVAVLGGWISLFGLVSYLFKEKYYISEALISLLSGVAFGPHGANLIRPYDYAACSGNHDDGFDSDCETKVGSITLSFSRLVLGVQLVLAGIQLPSKYLLTNWKPLAFLLGPVMTFMWLTTSLLVWGLAGPSSFLQALAIGACVTPTDPILSAVIVKGRFADQNIPKELQNLIIAESGANDGLGYPFLFFALYLIKYTGLGAASGNVGYSFGLWFAITWGYTILLSILYGAVVGWMAKKLLFWAEDRGYVDRESFLVFAVSLALFVLGTCGLIGTDDVLACFIAGNAFTWDDWFRVQTQDDSLQPTIDMILNVTIFLWYGAVIPWAEFGLSDLIPVRKLVPLGVLVLLFRRLPWIFALHKWIHHIEETRQALFVGFFGPIGVSAVFYLFITLEFIDAHLTDDEGIVRSDVAEFADTTRVVVWFLAACSIIIHGLSIPLGKLGYLAPQTISRALSEALSEDSRNNGMMNPHLVVDRRPPSPTRFTAQSTSQESSENPLQSVAGERRTINASPRDASSSDFEGSKQTPPSRREIRFHDDVDMPPSRREIRFHDDVEANRNN